jgi:AraC family transcriptional activator of pobA
MKKKTKNIPTYLLSDNKSFGISKLSEIDSEEQKHPHRHGFFQIIISRTAVGKQSIDFKDYPVQPNTWTFIAPGQIHQIELEGGDGVSIAYTSSFIERYADDQTFSKRNAMFHHPGFMPILCPSEKDLELLNTILGLFQNECERKSPSQEIIYACLKLLLEATNRLFSTIPSFAFKDVLITKRVNQILTLVDTYYRSHFDITFYAEQLNLTPKRANEICKQSLGITITRLIHIRLLIEARRMLGYENLNIKQVAFGLGFEDPAYFTRFFKRNVGITPEAFRNTCSKSTRQ